MACAVSYATPIRHLNHRTIDRDFTVSERTFVRSRAIPALRGNPAGGDAALAAARAAAAAVPVGNPFTSLEAPSRPMGTVAGDATQSSLPAPSLPPTPPPPPPPFPQAASRLQTRDLFSWMRRLGTLRYVKYPSVRTGHLAVCGSRSFP